MMKHRVLISEAVAPETIEFFEKNDISVKIGSSICEDDIIKEIQDCDAVLVRLMPITKRVLDNAKHLRIIAKHGVGTDSIDVEEAKKRGIVVVNAPGANGSSVAEHTIMLMLACSHRLKDSVVSCDYINKQRIQISEIAEKVLVLIGFGNVARKVAKMAYYGFNMRVIAYCRNNSVEDVPDYVMVTSDIERAMSIADYVSIHIPGTLENKGFINKQKIEKMKKTATLINTARGSVVDSFALLNAIKEGKIAGAGLDVLDFDSEAVFKEFKDHPNVVMTPHSAASSRESMFRMGLIAASGVVDFFSGIIPKYLV